NDLDTSALSALEELLEGWPGCALMVSHDRAFLDDVATSILAFEGDGEVTRYQGNHETYLRLRPPREPAKRSEPAKQASKPPPAAAAPAAKALSFNEKKELEGMMDRIAAAEAAVSAGNAELSDPALYSTRASEVSAVKERLARAEAELATLYAR